MIHLRFQVVADCQVDRFWLLDTVYPSWIVLDLLFLLQTGNFEMKQSRIVTQYFWLEKKLKGVFSIFNKEVFKPYDLITLYWSFATRWNWWWFLQEWPPGLVPLSVTHPVQTRFWMAIHSCISITCRNAQIESWK